MTLRHRITFFILIAFILFFVLYEASSIILLNSFHKIEQDLAKENIERAKESLNSKLDQLEISTLDYARWTDMWLFAQYGDQDASFHKENFNPAVLDSLGIDWMSLVNADGSIKAMTLRDEELDTEVMLFLKQNPDFLNPVDGLDIKKGLIMLAQVPALLISAPVIKSDHSGPVAGNLIMMRWLDEGLIEDIKTLTRLDVNIHYLTQSLHQEDQEAHQSLLQGNNIFIYVESNTLVGHTLLKDVLEQPLLFLEIKTPRPLYTQAQRSRSQLIAVTIGVMLLLILALYFLIQHQIVRGFQKLTESVRHITQTQNSQARLAEKGQDEFSQLGKDINSMLEALEQTQHKLRESEARYALATTGVNDGIWEWDISNDQIYFSARWMEMLGYEFKEYHDRSIFWLKHVHAEDLTRMNSQLTEYLQSEAPLYEAEYRMHHKDGSYRWVLVRAVAERKDGRAVRMAGSLTDITKRGVFDPLTGLPNRQLMNEYLKHAHSYSQRHDDTPAAVLFIDLNRFKEVNDSLGHQVGDLLLLEFSKRLQETVRGEDKIARLGGDEFVVLIEGLDEAAVLAVAERLSQETSRVYQLANQQVFSSSSIGIVTNLQRYENSADILRDADIAMYCSKAQKRPFVLFDDAMFRQVSEKQKLERDLRQALEKKELFVVYQPVVNLATQHIVGLEALLRWQHQDRLISPVEFIPIAEETGLIVPIGAWVLEEACRQVKQWQERLGRTDLYIAVNLSSRQLIQPNLVDTVKTLLEKTHLSAQSLQLEITESIVIENQSMAIKTLEDLRALGIYILMDDFGTGYSSLNYLTSLPIDRLKLDRSFSSQIETDKKTLEIVRTIIQLAHSVNMSVVAEGIESHNQAHLLNELNCEFGQGYLFAKPERLEKIETLLKQSSITIHS